MRWTSGSGVGFTWTSAFNSADLQSLANGSSVLSSVADITNQTSLDLYADVAIRLTYGTAQAIGSGAFISVYLFPTLDDGVTRGDGSLIPGTQAAITPGVQAIGGVPIRNALLTTVAGFIQGIWIPPGTFRFALQNQLGVAFPLGGACHVSYRTYNVNPTS